jgi:hypothetical protein
MVKHVEQEEIKCYTGKHTCTPAFCQLPSKACLQPAVCCFIRCPYCLPGALCVRVPAANAGCACC